MRTIEHKIFKPSDSFLKHLFIYILLLGSGTILFHSCDSTTSPENPLSDSPAIESLTLLPSSVTFTSQEDGFKDTTLTVEIVSEILNVPENSLPQYSITNKSSGEEIDSENLTNTSTDSFRFFTETQISTSTTSIEEYLVNIYFVDAPQIFAQTTLSIQGFSNNPPEILAVDNPEEVKIPTTGTTAIQFKSKVTDNDGQNTIQGAFVRIISESTGELNGSPFQLLDDGQSSGDSGDAVAQDSVYTITLEIGSGNREDFYNLKYYALDKGGVVSDTVKSTLRISE
jgi:hypothetical protein